MRKKSKRCLSYAVEALEPRRLLSIFLNDVDSSNLGKGMWAWLLTGSGGALQRDGFNDGDYTGWCNYLKNTMHLDYFITKAGDGDNQYPNNTTPQYNSALVSAAHSAGLKIFPYFYIYGDLSDVSQTSHHSTAEAAVFNTVFGAGGPGGDAAIFDIESQYGDTDYNGINNYFNLIGKSRAGDGSGSRDKLFMAYSSYDILHFHNTQLPWGAIADFCDAAMPQMYWKAHGYTQQFDLDTVDADYKNTAYFDPDGTGPLTVTLADIKPVIPTGQSYAASGTANPTAAEENVWYNLIKGDTNSIGPGAVSGWRYKGFNYFDERTLDRDVNGAYIPPASSSNHPQRDEIAAEDIGDLPGVPTLSYPASAATVSARPNLNWADVVNTFGSGSVGAATKYDVYIDGVLTSTVDVVNATGDKSSYNVASPLIVGVHTWNIVPRNMFGSGPSSATWTFTVDPTLPYATAVNRAVSSPTNAASVSWNVTFSESVTGVDTTDFALATTGSVSGATITGVTGSGTSYTVTASTGSNSGTLGLNLVDNDSIVDGTATKLGGTGTINGDFAGQVYTIDKTLPTVGNITSSVADATYAIGAVIPITISFSEPVTVAGGVPTLTLNSGGSASYASGSLTNLLTFNYTVASGQSSADLNYSTTSSLVLNGSTIKDALGNNATLNLPALAAAGSLGTNRNIVIEAVPPTITITPSGTSTNTSPITFTFTFSESVTGLTAGEITVTNGTKGTLSGSGTSWSIPVTPSGQGAVTAQVLAGAAQDAAGNNNTVSNTASVNYDTIAPTVAITPSGTATNSSPITFTITFSESVTGLTAGEITVTNGTKGTLSGSGTSWSIPVTPSGQGAVTAQVIAGAAQDAAGNNNTVSNTASVTYDTIAPTVAVTPSGTLTNSSPITFTFTFSESVAGLLASEITVTNGSKGTLSGSGTSWSIPVTPSGQGAVTCLVIAGAAQDAANNNNTVSNTASVTYDSIAPTVAVTPSGTSTNTSPITFTFTFSESVTGLLDSEITVTNGTQGTLSGSGTLWSIPVTPSGQGAVTCLVIAGAAQDAANNNNTVSNTASVTYDTIAPTVVVTPSGTSTNTSPITFTFTFSESVTGLTAGEITVTNGTKGTLSGSGTSWSIPVIPSAEGSVTALVIAGAAQDTAGNNNTASNTASVSYDSIAPTVTVTPSGTVTNSSPITFTFTFSESVTGLTAAGITVANGTKGTLSGSGTSWSIPVTPSGQGAVTAQVIAGAAQDAAGNNNTVSNTATVTYDTAAPTAAYNGELPAGGASSLDFTITYADATSGVAWTTLDSSDVTVTGPNSYSQPGTLISVDVSSNGSPRTATYRIPAPGGSWNLSDNGSYTIAQNASQVGDVAGNARPAATIGTIAVNVPFAWLNGSALNVEFDGSANPITLAVSGANTTATQNATTLPFPTASISSAVASGSSGNDSLIIDLLGGNPVPTGWLFYNGNAQSSSPGDILSIIGNGGNIGAYTPSTTTPGSGVINIGGHPISLTGLEPITISGFSIFTLNTPNANDILTIDSPAAGQNRISGTSNGVAFESLTFSTVSDFTLFAGADDGGSGDDVLTIASPGVVAAGSFNFKGGIGNDTLNINGGDYAFDSDASVDTANLTLNVGAGATVNFNGTQHLASLSIDGTATLASGGGEVIVTRNLSINALTGNLDLNDNGLIWDYTGTSPAATVRQYLINGRGGIGIGPETWAGLGGITSSVAANADPTGLAVGYREAQPPDFDVDPVTSFGGQTVDDTAILIRYTYAGDANLDGKADRDDLNILSNSFGRTSGVDWLHGDFDYNEICDRDDLNLLAGNFGQDPLW